MSRFMTDEEIAAEQAQIREQTAFTHGLDDVSPLDLLHSANYTDKTTRDARYAACKGCDRLFGPTRTCRECGCFMAAKTWLTDATCPLGKW